MSCSRGVGQARSGVQREVNTGPTGRPSTHSCTTRVCRASHVKKDCLCSCVTQTMHGIMTHFGLKCPHRPLRGTTVAA